MKANSEATNLEVFYRYLEARDTLNTHQKDMVAGLFSGTRFAAAQQIAVPPEDRPQKSYLILRGLAARFHITEDGRRRFSALHVAGDFIDLHGFLLKKMDHGILALTDCVFVTAEHAELEKYSHSEPQITRWLWMSTVIDAAIYRSWIVAASLKTADRTLAHFFCEYYVRLKTVGYATGYEVELPLAQSVVADLLGISNMQLTRALKSIRSRGFISWKDGHLVIEDFAGLAAHGSFDPTYLSLHVEHR